MIKYAEILDTITKLLYDTYKIDVYTNSEEVSDNECFYVAVNPSINKTHIRYANYRLLYIDIKYFLNEHDDKLKVYDMASKLDKLFSGFIIVGDRKINVNSNNIKFLKDDISDYLHYSIELEFYDLKDRELEKYELMQNIDLDNEEV